MVLINYVYFKREPLGGGFKQTFSFIYVRNATTTELDASCNLLCLQKIKNKTNLINVK